MKYLVTGFEPFADHAVNPSAEFVLSLTLPEFEKIVFPVAYDKVSEMLASISLERYDFVFLFGLAADRKDICLERVALNWIESSITDNQGKLPAPQKIDPLADSAIINTFPIDQWVRELSGKNLQAKISHSAGAYLCNYLYFRVMQKTPKALFIHIPKDIALQSLQKILLEMTSLINPATP